MPKNISPRYKKNYKGTNKTRGLCQCEKWRRCNSACVLAHLSLFSIRARGLQPCSPAPVFWLSRRFRCRIQERSYHKKEDKGKRSRKWNKLMVPVSFIRLCSFGICSVNFPSYTSFYVLVSLEFCYTFIFFDDGLRIKMSKAPDIVL